MESRYDAIEKLYFNECLSVVGIANNLGVSKQYVSKVLKNNFKEKYLEEKERRKNDNYEKRNKVKAKNIAEKRRTRNSDDVTVEELRRQHEISVRCMSKSGSLSNRTAIYANINAYDRVNNSLVFNGRVGARPHDMPQTYSLNIDVY